MGGLFSKTTKPQAAAVMPDESDPAVAQRRRLAAAEAQSRGGRTSTIMSTRASTGQPGTTAYTNSLLGQA